MSEDASEKSQEEVRDIGCELMLLVESIQRRIRLLKNDALGDGAQRRCEAPPGGCPSLSLSSCLSGCTLDDEPEVRSGRRWNGNRRHEYAQLVSERKDAHRNRQ